MPCPKCQSPESEVVVQGKDYLHHLPGTTLVAQCRRCGFWFQNPAPPPERLADLYPADYRPHAPAREIHTPSFCPDQAAYLVRRLGYPPELVPVARPRSLSGRLLGDFFPRWVLGVELTPRYVPGGRLLEIGCGSGGRLLSLKKMGWERLHGIELAPEAAAHARAAGLEVECGPVENVLERYPGGYFDVVLASMVLEHLADPFQVFRRVAAKLAPGGQFLFSTVVRDCWEARWYGEYWAGFDFPRHLVYFRKGDLQDMLVPDFTDVEFFHQVAPVDFIRSSTWRQAEGRGKAWDRAVLALGESPLAMQLYMLLALAGQTCRVSGAALKKPGDLS